MTKKRRNAKNWWQRNGDISPNREHKAEKRRRKLRIRCAPAADLMRTKINKKSIKELEICARLGKKTRKESKSGALEESEIESEEERTSESEDRGRRVGG